MIDSPPSSPDSLFDEIDSDLDFLDTQACSSGVILSSTYPEGGERAASRTAPPIPGLYIFPDLLPRAVANSQLRVLAERDIFVSGSRDQVMLFSNPLNPSIPEHTDSLLTTLESLLRNRISPEEATLLFDHMLGRQVIYNLYPPGKGISAHVDLPGRYADGIIGVSLTGGCVISFTRSMPATGDRGRTKERFDVYLPPRSAYVLTGEARWEWAHGIEGRYEDRVEAEGDSGGVETILRDLRVSVTFRWMKEGAEVLS